MRRNSEIGEGKFGTIVGLLVMAAIGLALWNVIPVYFANYSFSDKMTELARVMRHNNPDEEIMRKLMQEARDLRIEEYVTPQNCKIDTGQYNRKITCEYERLVEVIPGYKHRFHFKNDVNQPVI